MKYNGFLTAFMACLMMFGATRLFAQGNDGGAKESELWIQNGERRIYGVLSRPDATNAKKPLVIIAHGFNGTHQFGKNYFKPLNEMGYQCYTFDFPCGSVNSKGDNNTMEMSILDEVSDLKAIIKHFRNSPNTDASNIVVVGESQGGLVAALTAAQMPKQIERLILVYPALCIPQNWSDRYPDVTAIPDTTRLWNVPMGKRFFLELRNMNVFDTIARYKNPVIIIQGDADRVVSLDDSRKAVELYKDARLHVIPKAGHGFKPHEFQESVEQIRQFLKE